jgi:hypothetical protein
MNKKPTFRFKHAPGPCEYGLYVVQQLGSQTLIVKDSDLSTMVRLAIRAARNAQPKLDKSRNRIDILVYSSDVKQQGRLVISMAVTRFGLYYAQGPHINPAIYIKFFYNIQDRFTATSRESGNWI